MAERAQNWRDRRFVEPGELSVLLDQAKALVYELEDAISERRWTVRANRDVLALARDCATMKDELRESAELEPADG